MNITEFAALAGVSKSAVSRYFNGGYLAEDKKQQIARAAQQTGYHPSAQAQTLRTRQTRQIGVVLPKLSSESCARVVEGVGSVLRAHGYQLLLVDTANSTEQEVEALDLFRHNHVDGVIFLASIFTPAHKSVLERMHLPVVVVGQKYDGYSCVFHDDTGAALALTRLMLRAGRRCPGYLGVTLHDHAAGLCRRAGFIAALKEAGIPLRPERMCLAQFNMESGYEQAKALFEKAPQVDCLFCATDAIALGAMQYCREVGRRIPAGLLLAAVGDSRAGQSAAVPLTSAHLHYRTSGAEAAELLLQLLHGEKTGVRAVELGFTVVERASTGAPCTPPLQW
ncbi:MAG: LacI family DNA-binding transcriptional regulator [Gemmiger sp.]|nr:LacI family DNA-binding transcriptional regulator [Gemmiger sp.]